MAKQLLPGKPVTTEEIGKVVSDVRRGIDDWIMLDSCCGHRSIAIRAAIEQGLIIEVGDKFQLAKLPPLPIATIAITAPVTTKIYLPPVLPGCKCRNAGQPNKKYWLFTGWQADGILEVANYLKSLGINISLEPNGNKGNWQLIIPLYVTGEVFVSAQSRWKEEQPEATDVNNSFTDSTKTSSQTTGNNLDWIQRETESSFTTRTQC